MNLDLGAYYPIKVGEKRELRPHADWFNVFNSQRAITLDQTYSINSGVTGVCSGGQSLLGFGSPDSSSFGVQVLAPSSASNNRLRSIGR